MVDDEAQEAKRHKFQDEADLEAELDAGAEDGAKRAKRRKPRDKSKRARVAAAAAPTADGEGGEGGEGDEALEDDSLAGVSKRNRRRNLRAIGTFDAVAQEKQEQERIRMLRKKIAVQQQQYIDAMEALGGEIDPQVLEGIEFSTMNSVDADPMYDDVSAAAAATLHDPSAFAYDGAGEGAVAGADGYYGADGAAWPPEGMSAEEAAANYSTGEQQSSAAAETAEAVAAAAAEAMATEGDAAANTEVQVAAAPTEEPQAAEVAATQEVASATQDAAAATTEEAAAATQEVAAATQEVADTTQEMPPPATQEVPPAETQEVPPAETQEVPMDVDAATATAKAEELAATAPADSEKSVAADAATPDSAATVPVSNSAPQENAVPVFAMPDFEKLEELGLQADKAAKFEVISVESDTAKEKEEEKEEIGFADDGLEDEDEDVVITQQKPAEPDDDLIVMDTKEVMEEYEKLTVDSRLMHLDDKVNRANDRGEIRINVFKPMEKPVLVSPEIAPHLKPHQIGGVRFVWENIVDEMKYFGQDAGFGCILAHSMGLGKTLQVVTFVEALLRQFPAYTMKNGKVKNTSVLIVVPVNTISTWNNEFEKWLSARSRPNVYPVLQTRFEDRLAMLRTWKDEGGALIVGYEMLRKFFTTTGPSKKKKKKAAASNNTSGAGTPAAEEEEEDDDEPAARSPADIALAEAALVNPGPDVVICDEGHRIKNERAAISQLLKRIKSQRRVVLTGSPLQNNLEEYWVMVDFVRPGHLGSLDSFRNMFINPILNGQCADSLDSDIRLMRERTIVLQRLLASFVQRRDDSILRHTLPKRYEYVIPVRMTVWQELLYKELLNNHANNKGGLFKVFSTGVLIWNHPDGLYYSLLKSREEEEKAIIEAAQAVLAAKGDTTVLSMKTSVQAEIEEKNAEEGQITKVELLKKWSIKAKDMTELAWAQDQFAAGRYKSGFLKNSSKFDLLLNVIIRESVLRKEKVLVFSQSIASLDLLEQFMSYLTVPGTSERWKRDKHYYRLDGSTQAMNRAKLIQDFNDVEINDETHVFMLSTRAGSLGITLTAANKVVILDTSWNPSHDEQAVCRIYRYGQEKECHIYRFIAVGTMEETIFNRQINKLGLSSRVIDTENPERHFTSEQLGQLFKYTPAPPYHQIKEMLEDPSGGRDVVLNHIFGSEFEAYLAKSPFRHDSLLGDEDVAPMTSEQEKEVLKRYARTIVNKRKQEQDMYRMRTMTPEQLRLYHQQQVQLQQQQQLMLRQQLTQQQARVHVPSYMQPGAAANIRAQLFGGMTPQQVAAYKQNAAARQFYPNPPPPQRIPAPGQQPGLQPAQQPQQQQQQQQQRFTYGVPGGTKPPVTAANMFPSQVRPQSVVRGSAPVYGGTPNYYPRQPLPTTSAGARPPMGSGNLPLRPGMLPNMVGRPGVPGAPAPLPTGGVRPPLPPGVGMRPPLQLAQGAMARPPTSVGGLPGVPGTVRPSVPPLLAPRSAVSVTNTLPPGVPSTLAPGVPSSLAPGVPSSLAPSVPSTLAPSVPSTLAPSVPSTLAPSVPSTLAPSVSSTLAPSVPSSLAPAVKVPPSLLPAAPGSKSEQ